MNTQTGERLFDLTRDDDQRMNQDTMQRFAANEIRLVAKDADEAGATPKGFYNTGGRRYGTLPRFQCA